MRLGTALAAAAALSVAAAAGPARAADGLSLAAPADGSAWATGSTIRFAWTPALADPLVEALLIATDPRFADLVAVRSWSCDPACATGDAVTGFPAGTYYWGVGVKTAAGATVLSDPW